jgi:hypothetical protein
LLIEVGTFCSLRLKFGIGHLVETAEQVDVPIKYLAVRGAERLYGSSTAAAASDYSLYLREEVHQACPCRTTWYLTIRSYGVENLSCILIAHAQM